MDFEVYLHQLAELYRTGSASERSYYPILQQLMLHLGDHPRSPISILIEARRSQVGIPDFRVSGRDGNEIGYIEAKEPSANLDHLENSEQIKRYRAEYRNLILTNFLEFRLFQNGEKVDQVVLGQPVVLLQLKQAPPLHDRAKSEVFFQRFFVISVTTVRTAKQLATELADKGKTLHQLIREAINLADEKETNVEILYREFKTHLMSGLTEDDFADMYAQTIAYGLLAARLNTPPDQFSRSSAADHISQPHLLRRLFHFLAEEIPDYLRWIVDDIVNLLVHTDIERIVKDFEDQAHVDDFIVHFYETFLKEYDPKRREQLGVYYTPKPVVGYIVRSIHQLLKEKFGKPMGFADASVKVLDPAAGTMTFTTQAIRTIVKELEKQGQPGSITQVLNDHVLDHFFAFELLMAPYAIGHLKLSLLYRELTGAEPKQAFKLILTNTLENEAPKGEASQLGLIASELTKETERALAVKNQEDILVIFGNPPYSGVSQNKGAWITKLIEDYKVVDGKSLGERKHWLQDDYVKFIRFAQWKIEQTGQGIVGFITNHAWLDNPTFRGMRRSLMETFDEIYVLNLHGSTLKKEKTPQGGKDENVFDIQPGVAIVLMVKYA